jgi:hypothetical protein
MSKIKIAISEATSPQLLYYAQTALGLEVAAGANAQTLRAKIEQVSPGLSEIEVPAKDEAAPRSPRRSSAANNDNAPDIVAKVPNGPAGLHTKYDPKVLLEIFQSADATKPKIVSICVRGETVMLKRGVKVEMPYRYYLALNDAVENVVRDTDEINPITGLPIKEYVERHSYPFQVWRMPPEEEIAAWHERTDNVAMG